MSPEDLMRDSDALLVEMHVANVRQIHDTTGLRTELEQTRLLGAVALTARRMHGNLAQRHRTQAQIAADAQAIKASVMKAQAAGKVANENQAVAQEEHEMDDDSGRTPGRMAELHADIERRLELARRSREQKAVAGERVLAADRALRGGLQSNGGPPDPA